MIENVLKEIGLKEKEVQIYLALLPLGNAPASVLGKHTGIGRSTAQYTCHQLEKKGLIKSIYKKNTYFYTPEPPEKLQYLLDNKINQINDTKNELDRITADLISMINPHTVLPKVHFYEGIEDLFNLFDDELTLESDEVMYGAHRFYESAPKELVNYMQTKYDDIRKKKRYRTYSIWTDNSASKKRAKLDEELNRISLFVPEKDFPFESSFQMYRNKIVFYSYQSTDISGVMIENAHMRVSMQSVFRMAWNFARKLKANITYKDVKI